MSGEHVRVAVIGAGFAGIGAAMRLSRAGERSFLLLERASEVGGTWRDNVYPGVACDVPAHLYSFSFAPRPDWPRHYATGEEIRQYLSSCVSSEGLGGRVRTGVALRHAQWDEHGARWRLETSGGQVTASFLVLATGRFTEPRTPEVPGMDGFPGPVCHTARWRRDADPRGRRIGVIGTGASAVQLVPRLAEEGARVTVFQRSAPWVLPKADAEYSIAERSGFRSDDRARARHREELFAELDSGFSARLSESVENAALRRRAMEHLRSQVKDPALRAQLVPDYAIGCKRVVLSDEWYPALTSTAVTLEPSALTGIEHSTAIAASGARHELDALVLATGFEASRPAVAELVQGRGGTRLSGHWDRGMTAYASTAVSGFPNCFLLGGPNAALGHNSAVAILEAQIAHLTSALRRLPPGAVCEVLESAERRYTALVDARAAQTVWISGGCSNWYRDEVSGRLTLLWPGTAAEFAQRFSGFDPESFRIRLPSDRTPAEGLRPMPTTTLQETPV